MEYRIIATQIRERRYEGIDAPHEAAALAEFRHGGGHLIDEIGSEWQTRVELDEEE